MDAAGKRGRVERVRAATHRLFQDLLEQNRRLRISLAVLGQGRETAAPDLGELERWHAEHQSLLELLAAAERETERFDEQVRAAYEAGRRDERAAAFCR